MRSWLKVNSSTPWRQEQSLLTFVKALVGLHVVLTILIAITNSLFLITLIRKHSLHSASNILLGALCISDLLVGLLLEPVSIVQLVNLIQHQVSPQLFRIHVFLAYMLIGLSFAYMAVISCDRYFAICYPYKYLKYATNTLAVKTCGLVFVLLLSSILISFLVALAQFDLVLYLSGTILSTIGFLVIIISNCKVLQVLLKHRNQVTTITSVRNAQNQTIRRRAGERRRNNVVVILLIIFLMCYLPAFVMYHYGLGQYRWEIDPRLLMTYICLDFLMSLNSLINPLLYCYRLQPIRRAILETIHLMKRPLIRI